MYSIWSVTVVATTLLLSFGLALALQRLLLARIVRALGQADRRRDRPSNP